MSSPRNIHLTMMTMYIFVPMLFLPQSGWGIQEIKPPTVNENDAVIAAGGPGWVIYEEEEDDVEVFNQFEAVFEIGSALAPQTERRYFTGNAETPEVRRINWFKVAETSLPVTRNITTSQFGWRTPPCRGCSADHKGVDFVPGEGSPVVASMAGIVIDRGFNSGYGEYLVLEHVVPIEDEVQRWETVYAHMQKDSIPVEIQIGSILERKAFIGKVGNTGVSTGPHLHFEIRVNGEAVDPMPLLGNYQVLEVSLPLDATVPEDMVFEDGISYKVIYK